MKKNVKKYLIILIIFIVLVSIGVSLLMINKNTNLEPSDNNCLKKGNLCTLDEIKTGLVVPVAVNDNDTYDFYVIDNTAEQLILIMAKNIGKDVDWSMEGINFKGPVAPVFEVYDYTTNWDNINKITNYIYEDFGYKQCLALPDDSEEKNLCKFGGYIKFVINEKAKITKINLCFFIYYILLVIIFPSLNLQSCEHSKSLKVHLAPLV